LAALPGRESEFRGSIDQAAGYARAVAARRVHVMAGKPPAGSDPAEAEAVFIGNLRYACEVFAAHGIRALIEPINTRDMPGYFLTTPEQAAAIIPKVGAANLAMQFDIYHAQIMVGDVSKRLERHLPLVGHVQIAGVPERHEPDTGEINYPAVFRLLDRLGYTGWIGCEYRPARGSAPGGTSAGLGWLRRC
jgi:hydroxypyruvate isomerase